MNKKWIVTALKFLVSGLLIWFLLGRIDIADTGDRLLGVSFAHVGLGAAMLVIQIGVGALRWGAVLGAIGSPVPWGMAARLFYIGAFFNQTLPSSVGGDAVRIYKVHRMGHTLGAAVNGVMLERAATVVVLVLLVAATQPFFLPRAGPGAQSWAVPAVALFAAVTVGGLAFVMALDRLPAVIGHWRLVRGLALLAGDARKVFLVPGHAVRVLGWGVIGHGNVALAVYFLAQGLDLDVGLVDCLALIPPVLLITTLPISIAGWGVRELSMVAAFGLIGVPGAGALALSVLFGLVVAVMSLPGGLIWLIGEDRGAKIEAVPRE